MADPVAIISAVVEALGLALNLFKHISEACSAFGTELALVKSVSEKLNVISLEVKPLHGQRLHTDAAVLAVKQLEKHLDTWKPQLTAYLKKPPTGWRPFAKGLSRLFFKQPKMQVIMQGIQRGIEDHRNALDKANVQPVITVDRDLPKPHIKPYALNMLEGLLRDVHSSTQPPKVVVLRGENGTGKSILSILVAQDLEAAVDLQKKGGQKLFDGGAYRYPLSGLQRSQGLDKVTCTLQHWLARCLGHQQEGSDPETLYMQLDTMFYTKLQGRSHLVVIDGAWAQDLIRLLRFEHMHGPVLVTSENSLWEDYEQHEVQASTDQKAAAWPKPGEHTVLEAVLCSGPLAKDALSDAEKLMQLIFEKSSGILGKLSQTQQGIAAEVLALCGGNLEATALMAHNLAAAKGDHNWGQVRDLLRDSVGNKLNAAIAVSLKALQESTARHCQKAAAVFLLLQHVHAERMMPVPLVQVLIKALQRPAATTGPPPVKMKPLEAQSLLELLVHMSLLTRGTMSSEEKTYFTTPVVDIYLENHEEHQAKDEEEMRRMMDFVSWIRSDATAAERRQLALVLLVWGREKAAAWAWQHLELPGEPPSTTTPLLSSPELLCAVTSWDDTQGFLTWNVGRVLARAGKFAAARGLFEQALQRQPQPSTPVLTPGLAVLRAHTDQSFAAVLIELARENPALRAAAAVAALESLKSMEALNMSQPDIADACSNAGAAQAGCEQLAEAEALFMRALQINEALNTRGRLDKNTIIALNNLGCVLVMQGKLGAAGGARAKLEDALARVLSVQAALAGTRTHAVVLDTMGLLLDAEGKTLDAVTSYEASLAMKKKALGPEHPSTTATKQRLESLKLKGAQK